MTTLAEAREAIDGCSAELERVYQRTVHKHGVAPARLIVRADRFPLHTIPFEHRGVPVITTPAALMHPVQIEPAHGRGRGK